MIQSSFESLAPVGASARSLAAGLPFGARGAMALGSGLRSGAVLIDVAGQATANLDEVRKALAEAQREEVRAEARRAFTDEVRARTEPDGADPAGAVAEGGLGEGDALKAVAAAQIAAVTGETAGRGSFVNLAV